jgi:DNA-binding IclR family transcriptional regulator
MTPKAKALLRSLVGTHTLRVRKGESGIRLSPLAISDEHRLGIPPSELAAIVEELVREGLAERADGGELELTRKALDKTL